MNARPVRRLVAVAAAAFAAAGCDLIESAEATTVVGGIVISTPALAVPGRLDVSSQVATTAYVGERSGAVSVDMPTPIGDAQVTLTFGGVQVAVPVQDAAAGVYFQSSLTAPELTYVAGARYALVADINGSRFGGAVEAPDALTLAGLTLSPQPTPDPNLSGAFVHPLNTALSLSLAAQTGRYTYVTVFRADDNDPSDPQLVFDNRPTSTPELLQFIVGGPPTSQEIPANVFANAGLYAVVLVAMNNTDDLLTDTFGGSPILAGSGAAILLTVDQP